MPARVVLVFTMILVTACSQAAPAAPTPTAADKPTAAPATVAAATVAPPVPAPAQPAVPTASPSPSPAARARLENLTMAKGERNLTPVEPATAFRQGLKTFYLIGRVVDAPRGAQLKATWKALNAPDFKAPSKPIEKELGIEGTDGFAFSFELTPPPPPGQYAIELTIGAGPPQQVAFSVLPPFVPVLARPERDLPPAPGATAPSPIKPANLEFIVDASGSMADPVRNVPKIDAARDALQAIVSSLPTDDPNVKVGLRTYASRIPPDDKAKSCQDSELLVPLGAVDRPKLRAAIDGLSPLGWTPMAYAVQQAAKEFPGGEVRNIVVLVTDGEETCAADPVPPIKEAAASAKLVLHVIGFDISEAKAKSQLRAMADATGGVYVDASNADELALALRKITAEQTQVLRVQSGAGQLSFRNPEGATFYQWTIKDADGKQVVREYANDRKGETYPLAPGMYTVEFKPTQLGEGSLFRIEIGAGQESPLRLGGIKALARQQPYKWEFVDQQSERVIANPYGNDFPREPIIVPPGKYTIRVQQTQLGEAAALAKDVEVKPNTIVEVQL